MLPSIRRVCNRYLPNYDISRWNMSWRSNCSEHVDGENAHGDRDKIILLYCNTLHAAEEYGSRAFFDRSLACAHGSMGSLKYISRDTVRTRLMQMTGGKNYFGRKRSSHIILLPVFFHFRLLLFLREKKKGRQRKW